MVVQDSVSVAANTRVDVLAGFINSIIPPTSRGAVCRFSYDAAATGIDAEAWIGTRNVIENGLMSITNRIPQEPDDVVDRNLPAWPNEQLRLFANNTTGAAVIVFFRVTIDEV